MSKVNDAISYMAKYYQDTANLPVKEKVTKELKYRILCGLRPDQREVFKKSFEEIKHRLFEFFEKNPEYPTCPFHIWRDLLPLDTGNLRFYSLVVGNDNAVSRWVHKEGEFDASDNTAPAQQNTMFDGWVDLPVDN
jgi:hypothetical protein